MTDRLPDHIYNRLTNWARWANGHRFYICITCMSAERNYRPPGGEVMDEERLSRPVPVDSRDAMQVELAWSRLPLPTRTLLRAHWIQGQPDGRICRQLRIKRHAIGAEIHAATYMLWNRLVEAQHLAA